MKKFLIKLFRSCLIKCKHCDEGRVRHSHSEKHRYTTVEVYECDRCGAKFI